MSASKSKPLDTIPPTQKVYIRQLQLHTEKEEINMSSSVTTTTLTQDEIKAELKELMQLPENMICSDCDDKRPTWASLIVPPPNAPFKDPIGCFCCFQCSGAHRMLGTHISFVRSTNLDECKSVFFSLSTPRSRLFIYNMLLLLFDVEMSYTGTHYMLFCFCF